jgi:hypothetical protein
VLREGATKAFTLKMESWLTDLAVNANAPMPVDENGAPLQTYPLDPFVPPPRAPTSVPSVDPPPAGPSAPVASAVPPIPALAASAVPPIPGLPAGERYPPRVSSPSALAVLAAIVVVLVGVGVAGWLLWGDRIRTLLKI